MRIPSSWTPLHDRLHQGIRYRRLLQKSQRLLLAVSGGQDSLCLMQLLLELQPLWGWDLGVAHCNHRWRPDATANAAYVEQLAQERQFPFFGIVAQEEMAGEAAARRWRYQVLTEVAMEYHYSAVVTGHTASDRAETLLYNLLRGSGSDGLQALTWQRPLTPNVSLIRPLLEISRTETAEFCQHRSLQIWEDATNDDWQYARNRIRQELLPYLQTHFNPQVEQSLAQTAEVLRSEVEYLDQQAEQLYRRVLAPQGELDDQEMQGETHPSREGSSQGCSRDCRLNRTMLKSEPLALQRRVMRQALQDVLPSAPGFDHIEKLTVLITAPNRTQTDPFPGGAIARVEGDWITIGG